MWPKFSDISTSIIVIAILFFLLNAASFMGRFSEAGPRAKVSRMKADMRSVATAIESYAVDYEGYPDVDPASLPAGKRHRFSVEYSRAALSRLTTPVSYITPSKFEDAFGAEDQWIGYANLRQVTEDDLRLGVRTSGGERALVAAALEKAGDLEARKRLADHGFILTSAGPDKIDYMRSVGEKNQGFAHAFLFLVEPGLGVGWDFLYDPTNGTSSTGDIVRTAGGVLN
jgi:hypothetical protein